MATDRLNIAFVFDGNFSDGEGVSNYIETFGSYFKKIGHKVSYIVGESSSSKPDVFSLGRTVTVKFNGNRVDIPLITPRRQVNQLLGQIKPDIIHIQMPYSPFLGSRFINQADSSTGIVGTFHVFPDSGLTIAGSKLLRLATKSSLKKIDLSLSVSTAAQAFARSAFRIESEVLPCPIDLGYFKSGKKLAKYADGKLNILFFGRLVERKGCQHLIEAVNRFSKSTLSNVRVIVAGRGPLLKDLKTKSIKYGLESLVDFLGYINEADKPDLLASADIAVFPSTGGESFGIVLTEAMASGAGVVLGGDNAGYSRVLNNQSDFLFNPTDTASFADKLEKLIADRSLITKHHAYQQNIVKDYDILKVGPVLIDDYRRALKLKNV